MASDHDGRFGRFLATTVRSFEVSLMSPPANVHDPRAKTGDQPSIMVENDAIVFDDQPDGTP